METPMDYYALLGVARTASLAEIQAAIRQGIRTWSKQTARPERDRRQAAERKLRQLKEAREVLLDDARRREYDRRLVAAATTDALPAGAADDVEGWLDLARQALATADYRTAVRAAEEAMRPSERSVEVWQILAQANAGLGRFDDAIFQLRRVAQLDPENVDHLYQLADCYEQVGDWDNALRTYEVLATRLPGSELPHLGTASVFIASGDPARALALLEELHTSGSEWELAGDYLAMALVNLAEQVPDVRDSEGYAITSAEEISMMRRYLAEAHEAAHNPDLRRDIAGMITYVERMAGSEFVWRRLFGRWGRRYFATASLLVCCGGIASSATEGGVGLLALAIGFVLVGGVSLLAHAHVPRWKFNRAQYTGHYLTY